MNQWEVAGILGLLIIIAVGIATGVNNLDVIARELRSIRDEVQGLRGDLNRRK
jgi:uncharacterized protein (DUF3084 family)